MMLGRLIKAQPRLLRFKTLAAAIALRYYAAWICPRCRSSDRLTTFI